MSYILVVDDEKDIRDLIGEILVDDGHDVRLAENSEQAINFINETKSKVNEDEKKYIDNLITPPHPLKILTK